MINNKAALNSNIYKFQKNHNFNDFDTLFNWSVTHRDEFWAAAIDAIGIKFNTPYTKILDLTDGVTAPQWLVGARYNIVESCFKAEPHKTAIIYQTVAGTMQTITYEQLHALANRVANSLNKLNLAPGSKIVIDMLMTVEAVAIYLGIIQAGYVAVGIADSFAASEVEKRVQISDAKLLFTQDIMLRDGKQLELYEKLHDVPIPKIVLPAATELTVNLQKQDKSWQEFLVGTDTFQAVNAHPNDAINILFSSGTTGDPKAIVWDQTSPLKCAVDGYFYQDIQPRDIIAWPSSLGWMMGPWLVFAALINGATIALYYDVPTTRKFCEFVANTKVTILGLVPSLVKAWRMHDLTVGLDWSNIKLFTSTGETSNAPDMQYLMQTAGGKPIIEYCGGTEISGAYITSTLLQENIAATFSTPTLGLDIVLLDENKQLSDIGEVAIVAPSIGLSRVLLNRDNTEVYYQDMPQIDGKTLRRHGDQLQRLENGYYKSLGRADDAMNLGGIKISAAEIEHCFLDMPEISEAVAVCKNNEYKPAELVMFVVAKDPQQVDVLQLQKTMQQAINTKLNPLFKISVVRLIDAIPRTSSNKIMRRLLRDML